MTATTDAALRQIDVRRIQQRTIAVLCAAQVVSGMGMSIGFAFSALVVQELSGSTALSGLAGTAVVLGAALFALPTARLTSRSGRRAGLMLAFGAAFAGSAVAVVAIGAGSWQLLLASLLLAGAGSAGNLSARYAATDLSPPGHAARHLSWVVWAATVGAVAGPNLAEPAAKLGETFGLAGTAGPFAIASLGFGAAALALFAGLRPDPLLLAREAGGRDASHPLPVRATAAGAWATIKAVPAAKRAVLAIAVGHTAMVSIMSMTPVYLHEGHAELVVIGLVISIHVAGMYLLAPGIGWLADRLGKLPVIGAGMILLLAAATLAGAGGHNVPLVTGGLFLLGAGWSCCLVGGSSMLSESLPLDSRPAAQGFSDLMMNVCGATGAVVAGGVMGATSYQVLAILVGCLVILTALNLARPAASAPA